MQTGPKGINWTEALIFYCTSSEGHYPSYQDVSEKYSVSTRIVEQRACKDNWVKVRQELGKKELDTVILTRTEEIKRAEIEHLRVWRELQTAALTALNKYNLETTNKTQDLKNITETLRISIAGERTVLNLPNNVSKSEVTNVNPVESLSPEQIEQIDRLLMADYTPSIQSRTATSPLL